MRNRGRAPLLRRPVRCGNIIHTMLAQVVGIANIVREVAKRDRNPYPLGFPGVAADPLRIPFTLRLER